MSTNLHDVEEQKFTEGQIVYLYTGQRHLQVEVVVACKTFCIVRRVGETSNTRNTLARNESLSVNRY